MPPALKWLGPEAGIPLVADPATESLGPEVGTPAAEAACPGTAWAGPEPGTVFVGPEATSAPVAVGMFAVFSIGASAPDLAASAVAPVLRLGFAVFGFPAPAPAPAPMPLAAPAAAAAPEAPGVSSWSSSGFSRASSKPTFSSSSSSDSALLPFPEGRAVSRSVGPSRSGLNFQENFFGR